MAVRVWLEPGRRKLRPYGLPVTDHPFLDSFSLDIEGKQARYAELLRELPAGLSEWAVHPGLGTAESRAVDPDGWRVRRSDYAFLTSPEARELVRQEGIAVIDYRALQQTWSRIGTPR
ncbi:ChbG/HpnK family deacetylase [Streptomyces scopuliridis]|uniref:ChbG/HpnK family deacetylase n=1 Tax=Streptomyces scopuliridis TaxID=452529 RepID=UPI0036CD542C